MKILGVDVSKVSTGLAFYDGELYPESLQTITFESSVEWEEDMSKIIEKWNPEVIVFSETVSQMCGQDTKRIMFGLMFLLEHIAYKKGISCIPINDTPVKHFLGVRHGKRAQIKADTRIWFEKKYGITGVAEDAIDACAFCEFADAKLVRG